MKTLRLLVLSLLAVMVIFAVAGIVAYAVGSKLPVDHSVSSSATIAAPPARVFARIIDIAAAPSWRPAVKSVKVLPQDNARDHWVEDLGHGQTMTFLATKTDAPARREVLLDVPGAAYGGTWTYDLSPGPSPNTTTLKITETGFIHPPLYRFMMVHLIGPTHNLDVYLKDLQAAVPTL